ncbi:hypothetical protein J437_LFUL001130 [Ladona fulva]|uniref:Uncharacterized protein n=1 Tax=Ladona fulva TaxID=123851 RepID=A0A8K0K157_LADFU|nr:hypothetical protein J437_LFUL001130 [Ladona fulva]
MGCFRNVRKVLIDCWRSSRSPAESFNHQIHNEDAIDDNQSIPNHMSYWRYHQPVKHRDAPCSPRHLGQKSLENIKLAIEKLENLQEGDNGEKNDFEVIRNV